MKTKPLLARYRFAVHRINAECVGVPQTLVIFVPIPKPRMMLLPARQSYFSTIHHLKHFLRQEVNTETNSLFLHSARSLSERVRIVMTAAEDHQQQSLRSRVSYSKSHRHWSLRCQSRPVNAQKSSQEGMQESNLSLPSPQGEGNGTGGNWCSWTGSPPEWMASQDIVRPRRKKRATSPCVRILMPRRL